MFCRYSLFNSKSGTKVKQALKESFSDITFHGLKFSRQYIFHFLIHNPVLMEEGEE